MGGYSSEYQISLKSGAVVYETLDRKLHTPFAIHIFKDKWVYVAEDGTESPIDRSDFSVTINGKKITFDCVFNEVASFVPPICP